MPRSADHRLPYLWIGLGVLILVAPVLFTGQALYWGTPSLQFVPWREYAFETLRNGHLPFWNPLVGMGAPLLANYQSALLYPGTWLLFILSSIGGVEWHAWGQILLVGLHWAIAGIGMARLARRLGLGSLAQALSGLGYGLGAYLVTRAGFLSINAAAAWLPWIVDYAGRLASPLLRQNKPRRIVWLKLSAVAALQLLAGHAQMAWYTALLAFAWGGYWAWIAPEISGSLFQTSWISLRARLRSLAIAWFRLAGAYLMAVGLSAVQLIPTAEYLLESQRAGAFDYEAAMTYSYWPWRFITLLAPAFFGSPVSGDYWGYGNYWEDAVYVGVLPLLLALAAILRWLRRKPSSHPNPPFSQSWEKGGRDFSPFPQSGEGSGVRVYTEAIPFLLVLTVFSFLLALGKNTPIFPWLYQNVPTFDMFQAPSRFTLWAAFALPLLAGIGAQSWRRPEGRALYWTRLGTAGAAAVTIGAGLAWLWMGDVSPTFIHALALLGLLGVIAGALSLLAPPEANVQSETGGGHLWQIGVALFVLGDLLVAGWGMNPGVDTGFYHPEAGIPAESLYQLGGRRFYLSAGDEYDLKFRRFFRFDGFDSGEDPVLARQVALPNLPMLDGIASINNFDPLVPARYATWMEALEDASASQKEIMLDLSGIGVAEAINSDAENGVQFGTYLVGAGMRARWLPCGRYVSREDILDTIAGGKLDPTMEVILEEPVVNEATQANCLMNSNNGRIEYLEEHPDRLIYTTNSTAPGWFLLSDIWYPGWKALVDGEEQPIYRGDYLFRAVFLKPGEHVVEFRYRPASFYVGLAISLASLLLWLGLFIHALRESRRRTVESPPVAAEPVESAST